MANDIFKQCSRCKIQKPVSAFNKSKKEKDGLQKTCKECQSEYNKKYYPANADKIKTRVRQWVAENQDKVRNYHHKSYRKHAVEINKYCVDWKRNNPEKAHAIHARWDSKNRAKITTSNHNRRANKLGVGGAGVTDIQWKEILEKFGNRCVACGSDGPLTMDHITPLSLGGLHDISNIQPLCSSCNAHKYMSIVDYRTQS